MQCSENHKQERGSAVGRFLAVIFLLIACVHAPLVLALMLNAWVGLLAAVGCLWVWGRLGPRPSPGYASGTLCIWGFAGILGSLVACSILAFRGMLV
jgi:hypothetical protein